MVNDRVGGDDVQGPGDPRVRASLNTLASLGGLARRLVTASLASVLDPEDLLQDGCLRIIAGRVDLSGLEDCEREDALRRLLCRMACEWRRSRAREEIRVAEWARRVDQFYLMAHDRHGDGEWVRVALHGLCLEDRRLVVLAWIKYWPVGALAKRLGCSRAEVYRRLDVLRDRLRWIRKRS